MRVYYYKLYKKFKLISSKNKHLFYTVILNFITDMSSARNLYIEKISNVILIIVNKLIKYVIYIIIIKDFIALKFKKLL